MSSTSFAFEFPSTTITSPFPTSTITWMNGQFPSSLTITGDRSTEKLIADVPFYSVGILAFGVATFFFVMNRMQKHVFDVLLATFLAFVSAILDLGQLIIISRGVFTGTVFPLRIARELGYAVSFGMRFFFFWRFVAMPPRGEIAILPTPGRSNRSSYVMDEEFHSGSWGRWGITGVMAKYTLLMGTIAVGVTQSIWRLGFSFGLVRFTSVYRADAILQIVMSGLFILKLVGNSYLSPLTPRWRTFRDYIPVATAMSIGLGIAIGNLLCMRFSESPLGRFLQSIELYILILYVLIATFYNMPVRASMIADALDRERGRATSSFVGINIRNSMRGSTFRITPPNVSTPNLGPTRELEAAGTNGVPNRLLRPDVPRRMSTTERLATWIQNRLSGRPSEREVDAQVYSTRGRGRDVEAGQESYDYTDKKRLVGDNQSEVFEAGIDEPKYGWQESANVRTPPTGTSTAVNDTPQYAKQGDESKFSKQRESTVLAGYAPARSYAPAESKPVGPSSRRGPSTVATAYSTAMTDAFSPIIAATLAPVNPLSVRSLPGQPRLRAPAPETETVPVPIAMPVPVVATPPPVAAPPPTESPSGTSFRITREYGLTVRSPSPQSLRIPSRMTNSGDESPIYGLEGIIASLGEDLLPDEEYRPQRTLRADSATYSPGAASFLQKQVELDQSVADLRAFSPRRPPPQPLDLGENLELVPSAGQESTSLRSDFSLSNFPSPPPAIFTYPRSERNSISTRPGEVDLDDIGFTLAPPRMPVVATDGRQTSFPSTTRGSDIMQIQSRPAANSNGTQWDVTSFIGGSETRTPSSSVIARPESQGRPFSYARNMQRRDTMDTQRLSMVIEALSNSPSTSDMPDEASSVRGARIIDLRRASSLSRARIVDVPVPTTASSVNTVVPQSQLEQVPAPMPTAAERLAAFRARPAYKNTLPSSPRPAYRADSPTTQGRSSPLGGRSSPLEFESAAAPIATQSPLQTQPVLQTQPSISAIQAQPNAALAQLAALITPPSSQARTFAPNSVLTPPRGLRNLRIGGPVEQPQNENELRSGAFERPRPAPLVLAGVGGAPRARAV
ncbi:hypothetical protein BDV93DRAFT_521918 [Ceratobasidium sp. AG-I]|nr:hypothetical protein BDV93DRAFT_521918 [Ceratobasidium sp. AG-I]